MTFVLIDDNSGPGGGAMLFEAPAEIVVARAAEEVDEALARIEAAVREGAWAAGYFAYELGYLMEPRLRACLDESSSDPLIWMGLFDRPRTLGPAETSGWLTARRTGAYCVSGLSYELDERTYERAFKTTQRLIAEGDIYQLNYTFQARFHLDGDPVALYCALRKGQRVPYGALIDTGEGHVLSLSPELFLELADGRMRSRPMKGTAPRAPLAAEDEAIGCWLCTDAKSRAENLMIVDLMRNDLGRIAKLGSVRVSDLFTRETFRTLHQMTSGIEADLADGTGLAELMRAVFPAGSVTGAPKLRAMEIIHDLEARPRGVYTGAIGLISPERGGRFGMRLNVGIRTITLNPDGRGQAGIGSGLVHDSECAAEYRECLLKLRYLTDPGPTFELIETMLWEAASGFALLDRHMSRLAQSARYFGFAFDEARCRAALDEAVHRPEAAALMVRLLLAEDGGLAVTAKPFAPPGPEACMRYVFSAERLDPEDLFLYHKTTRRALYDREHERASATWGADEVVFLNKRGELGEGSRTNLFIKRGDVLLTPPLSAGILPGTLRAELLDTGRAVERKLWPEDLETAEAVYLGNSVRGLIRAEPLHVECAAGL